jgi:putative protein kinase ArgK-like GTPase of G3E family
VLLSPESGDRLQMMKSGLLELGDVFLVNMADRPGADALAADVMEALHLSPASPTERWVPPVLLMAAAQDDGIDAALAAIAAHQQWLLDHEVAAQQRYAPARLTAAIRMVLEQELAGVTMADAGYFETESAFCEAVERTLARLGDRLPGSSTAQL